MVEIVRASPSFTGWMLGSDEVKDRGQRRPHKEGDATSRDHEGRDHFPVLSSRWQHSPICRAAQRDLLHYPRGACPGKLA